MKIIKNAAKTIDNLYKNNKNDAKTIDTSYKNNIF